MVSAVVTVLLIGVMVLVTANLIVSALRAQRRHRQSLAAQGGSVHPLDRHVTAVLHLHDGMVVGIERPQPAPSFTLSSSWYSRHKTIVSLCLLLMLLLALFVQGSLAGDAFHNLTQSFNFLNATQGIDLQTAPHPLPDTASTRLVRVDSALRTQYYTNYQWQVWSYSSCSGIAMEMVMNAYGRHLIAADVLQEELKLGVWDAHMGILSEEGIALTANYFGFNATLSHTRTLQSIIIAANKGTPVIVSVRDGTYFPGGHVMVVRGGDSQYVYTADSSPANFQRMTYPMFINLWQGNRNFSAILTPQ